jgi:hypothetical protein
MRSVPAKVPPVHLPQSTKASPNTKTSPNDPDNSERPASAPWDAWTPTLPEPLYCRAEYWNSRVCSAHIPVLLTSRPERETTVNSAGVRIMSRVQSACAKRLCESSEAHRVWLQLQSWIPITSWWVRLDGYNSKSKQRLRRYSTRTPARREEAQPHGSESSHARTTATSKTTSVRAICQSSLDCWLDTRPDIFAITPPTRTLILFVSGAGA